jgi:hypothetical protein
VGFREFDPRGRLDISFTKRFVGVIENLRLHPNYEDSKHNDWNLFSVSDRLQKLAESGGRPDSWSGRERDQQNER